MTAAQAAPRRPITQLLIEATHPISDLNAWNRVIQRINPLWSANEIRAKVLHRVEENDDTLSLWLEPNRRWSGCRAGQHVIVGVEIDGVMRRRVFSLSGSAGRDRGRGQRLRITIQRQPGSGVTHWLHASARSGMIMELSAAEGHFVLPDAVPPGLLMIAGGSGITPLMAMLQQLARQRFCGDIVLLQLCRHADQRLFGDELRELGRRLPGLSVHVHDSATQDRLPAARIRELVPDMATRHTLLCGPEGLIRDICNQWDDLGLGGRLALERFAAPRPAAQPGAQEQVHAVQSEQVFTQKPGTSLLEAAESAGLTPNYGCRAGLCRTCLCRKQSGTTRNLLTGLSSSQPDEWIQLCVSVAESDLELAL